MPGFARIRSQSLLTVYLSIAVFVAFLVASVDPIRTLAFETPELKGDVYYTAQVSFPKCLATAIGRNSFQKTLSLLRLGFLRLIMLWGMYTFLSPLCKSGILRNIQTTAVPIKQGIRLKLRI
jgi:hypothetical protein